MQPKETRPEDSKPLAQPMQRNNDIDDNPFPWMSKKPTTPPHPQQAPPTGKRMLWGKVFTI